MRFTIVILSAVLCLDAGAQTSLPERDSDEAIMAAAEKLVAEGKALKTETPVEAAAAKPEAEIPVFVKSEKTEKSESGLIWRLVTSLALIGIIATSVFVAARRWTQKKNVGGEKARIEILHQFHMGPRKSVALIRVAGEAILIGCTDHSINLIKSVALIDDELEGALNKDFNNFLEDEFRIEDVHSALSQRA